MERYWRAVYTLMQWNETHRPLEQWYITMLSIQKLVGNNLIEQDHRFIKRLTKPAMGFFSFETARRTLQGFEIMNMIRKGQVQGVAKGNITGQVTFIASLFGVAV